MRAVRHGARGVEHLRGFSHEQHAAKRDHVPVKITGGSRELKTISHRIGQLLDFSILIMMRQNHGPASLFQLRDFFCNRLNSDH